MLRKLIAYDFRCTWKMMVTLFLTSFVAAILSAVCGIMQQYIPFDAESVMYTLAYAGLMMGQVFLFMLSYLGALGTILISGIHYYKKIVSDEAYLTFTLPATVGQHLTAKLVTGFVWTLTGIVVFLINLIIISIPSALLISDTVPDTEVVSVTLQAADVTMIIGVVVLILALLATELLLAYLALTIGGVIANKYKALVGIGLYWVGNSVVSGMMMFAAIIVSAIFASLLPLSVDWTIAVVIWLCAAVVGGFGVLYYFFNRKLLTNKLNLP
ncbi:MAG: hypothetical protein IJW98_04650 [Clostridia bacterium]|nr:hypothetical protein [Clostridia bacterium]